MSWFQLSREYIDSQPQYSIVVKKVRADYSIARDAVLTDLILCQADNHANQLKLISYSSEKGIYVTKDGVTTRYYIKDGYGTKISDNVYEFDLTQHLDGDIVIEGYQSNCVPEGYSIYDSAISFEKTAGAATVDANVVSFDLLFTADTSWTASTDADWVSLSVTGGVAGAYTMVVSMSENTGEKRQAEISFELESEVVPFILKQRAPRTGAGIPLHLGEIEVPTIALGDLLLDAAYLGETIVFSTGVPAGLTIRASESVFHKNGGSFNLSISSEFDWSIVLPDGLVSDVISGTKGRVRIPIQVLSTDVERNLTLTVNAGDLSQSLTIAQDIVEYVELEYIKSDGITALDTGIIPNVNTVVNVSLGNISRPDYWSYFWGSGKQDDDASNFIMRNRSSQSYFIGRVGNQAQNNAVAGADFITDGRLYTFSFGAFGLKDASGNTIWQFDGTPIMNENTWSIWLGGANFSGSIYKATVSTFGHFDILDASGQYIFRGVPCTFDGKVGMWDLVENVFHEPQSGHKWVAGPIKSN